MDVQLLLQTQAGVTPIKNAYIDMFDDETIELTRSIQDVRDISKQFSDYSKSFNVPASARNNEAFKFFFKTDFLNGYNQHQEAQAILEFKGIPLLAGTIELMGASTYKGKEQSYEVVFYGNVKSISQIMGEDTLPQIDWSAYGHVLDYGNVAGSWNGNLFNSEIVYPLWDCSSREGGWLFDSNNAQTNDRNIASTVGAVQLDELKPAIRLKEFIESIFANYGLTVNSNWLGNADTLKMYVQPQRSAGVATNSTGNAFNLYVLGTQNYTLPYLTDTKIFFPNENYDNGNSWDDTTSVYTAGYTGAHNFTLRAEQFSNETGKVQVNTYVNGVAKFQGDLNFNANSTIPFSQLLFTVPLTIGDTVEIYVKSFVNGTPIELFSFQLRKTVDSGNKFGNPIDLAWEMPPQKVSEFFGKFLQTFNLILDPTSLGVYTLEPLEDWYALGGKHYFDKYIDQKELVYGKIPIYKNIELTHENAENDENIKFTQVTGRKFGQVLWDSDLEGTIDFADGDLTVESPFNVQVPTIMLDNAGLTSTQIEYQRFYEEDDPVLSELNLAYFNGVLPCSGYYMQTATTPTLLTFYPNFSFVDSAAPTNTNFSLAYSLEQAANFAVPFATLYERFYNTYLRRLYATETRMVICTAVLSLTQFQGLKLNDTIHFQGINYIINSLVYDFNKQIAKFELISLINQAVTQQVLSIDPSGQILTTLPPSANDVNLYNATPASGASTLAIGDIYVNQDMGAVLRATTRGQRNNTDPTVWRGDYAEGGYPRNSIVLQNGWLMISTDTTLEDAAPQPIGDPDVLINGNWTPTSNSANAVITHGHKYTFTASGWLKGILVYLPFTGANYTNNLYFADVTNPDNIIYDSILNLQSVAQEWVTVIAGNKLIASGTELIVVLETTNSSATSDFSDGWQYGGSSNNAPPPANGWNKRNQDNIVRFEYQSLGGNYITQIQNLIPNSTITISENGAPENSFTWLTTGLPTDEGSYAEIPVTLTNQNGNIATNADCDVTFSSPVPQPATYIEDVNFWNNFPPPASIQVDPILEYDGVPQVVPNQAAFGVDLLLQGASISEDWDVLAYTSEFGQVPDDGAIDILNILESRHIFNADPLPPPYTSTTLGTWVSDVTQSLLTGGYILDFSMVVNQDRTNRSAFYELWVDGVSVLAFHLEAKDINNEIPYAQNSIFLQFNVEAPHTIELKARCEHQQLDLTMIRFAYSIALWQE